MTITYDQSGHAYETGPCPTAACELNPCTGACKKRRPDLDRVDPDKERQAEAIAKANGITAAPVAQPGWCLGCTPEECEGCGVVTPAAINAAREAMDARSKFNAASVAQLGMAAQALGPAVVAAVKAAAAEDKRRAREAVVAAHAAPVAQPVSDADILNAIAANYHAAPAAPVALTDDDLRDMADSACQEALSFGVGADVFLRLARSVAKRAAHAAPVAQPVIPVGWVPLTLEFEPGYPEEVAFGPQRMMDRLKKWLDAHFARRIAESTSQPVSEPAHAAPVAQPSDGQGDAS